MIALFRQLNPAPGEIARGLFVLLRRIFMSQFSRQLSVCSQSHDGFDLKIRVVRQMAGEVIGTKLIFRVQPFFF